MASNNNSLAQPTLHLPEGMRYLCIQCGRSCQDFAEIPVDVEMAESISRRPAGELRGAADPVNPVVDSPWSKGGLAMRTDDHGRCCLLTGHRLCALHAAFGPEAKPLGCRAFPYHFIETPVGVYVGLSFACSAVLGNHGVPVSEQAYEIRQIYALGMDRRRVDGELLLDGDVPIDWPQYLQIEQDLKEMLDPERGTMDERLLAQAVYLRLLTRALREVRRESGRLTAGPEVNTAMLETFHRQMRGETGNPWARIFEMTRRPHRPRVLRRTFLGFALALRQAYGRRRGRLRSYQVMMNAYLRYSLGLGRIDLPHRDTAVTMRAARHVQFDPTLPDHDELMTRYFTHCLHRKDLLGEATVLFQHSLMLMNWGLVHWYSAGFAAEAGRDNVELDQLREGLRSVEKYYVFHSTFSRIFSEYPVMRGMIDRMFSQPLYPYAMCRR